MCSVPGVFSDTEVDRGVVKERWGGGQFRPLWVPIRLYWMGWDKAPVLDCEVDTWGNFGMFFSLTDIFI